ncbi:hypothetical protein Hanom_Chr07g00621181 [Helianthus anomalus]
MTRKLSSNVELLDYVIFSNSFSGLDAGVNRSVPDPDDEATLTEMMVKKPKSLQIRSES